MPAITQRLGLQAKIIVLLLSVLLPTFFVVKLIQNQFTRPFLEEEIRQTALASAKRLATEIMTKRLFMKANATPQVADSIQEMLYLHPNILRVDVIGWDPQNRRFRLISTNIEDQPDRIIADVPVVEKVTSKKTLDENNIAIWEITVPIIVRKAHTKIRMTQGMVHLEISTKTTNDVLGIIWKVNAVGTAISIIIFILLVSFFLRKTIANDRALQLMENEKVRLLEQLHEIQRKLMNMEKLSAIGQLAARFAHEIGTPLNSVGGHLQLLQEEIGSSKVSHRIGIISDQLAKIESIVRDFLQTTAKPATQTQLVDLNRIVDNTLAICHPKTQSIGIKTEIDLEHKLDPVRAVPVEIEQVLLNLMNNAIDSLQDKAAKAPGSKLLILITTRQKKYDMGMFAEVEIHDTGMGVSKERMKHIFEPFYTTKRPGEGTGLGLSICQEIAKRHGGLLNVQSKEGSFFRITLQLPFN